MGSGRVFPLRKKIGWVSLSIGHVPDFPGEEFDDTIGHGRHERGGFSGIISPRGGWRQRVGKEKPMNLRDPADGGKVGVDHRPHRRESEGIVVAGKQGNSCGAKGSCCKSETIGPIHSRLPEAITGENVYLTDRIRVGNDERLQESRMRKIRTSGLTMGEQREWRKPPAALYSTVFARDNS